QRVAAGELQAARAERPGCSYDRLDLVPRELLRALGAGVGVAVAAALVALTGQLQEEDLPAAAPEERAIGERRPRARREGVAQTGQRRLQAPEPTERRLGSRYIGRADVAAQGDRLVRVAVHGKDLLRTPHHGP